MSVVPKSLTLLFALCLCCFSCDDQPVSDEQQSALELPELLKRPVALQDAMEWDRTQSAYMQESSKLRTEDPEAIEPRINLAKIFVNEARVTGEHGHYYPAALRMLDEALDLNHSGPKDPNLEFDALSTKAGVELSQHDFAAALETAKAAVSINPYNAQVYGAVVDANVELGRYEAAVKASDKMNEIRPDLRSYSRASYLREIYGDPKGAIDAMKKAVNAGAPGFESTAWARLTLGELYRRYGQPEEASRQYQSILVERPNYPFAIAAQAELAVDDGDDAKAESLLKEAMGIIPEVGYYTQLAEVYKRQGRTEELRELETEIEAMLKDDVNSGHNMDMEYAALHLDHYEDYDRALEYMQKEYAVRPDNIDVNRMLARVYVKKGDYTKAAEHLARAEATDSKHPELEKIRKAIAEAPLS